MVKISKRGMAIRGAAALDGLVKTWARRFRLPIASSPGRLRERKIFSGAQIRTEELAWKEWSAGLNFSATPKLETTMFCTSLYEIRKRTNYNGAPRETNPRKIQNRLDSRRGGSFLNSPNSRFFIPPSKCRAVSPF